MDKPKVRAEQWMVVGQILIGKCYDHPNLPDGSSFVSSQIVEQRGWDEVETQNSIYVLGNRIEDCIGEQ